MSMLLRPSIAPRFLSIFLCIAASGIPAFAQKVPPKFSDHYALILADPPVLDRFPAKEFARSAAGENYRRDLEGKQRILKAALESRNFHVVGSVAMSSNSVFVIAPPQRVAELESLPGVIGVR